MTPGSPKSGNIDGFTEGRYVVSWIGADGARDPIALSSQVKAMRDGFESLGHKPALILVVTTDGEQDAAVQRIVKALDDPQNPMLAEADDG